MGGSDRRERQVVGARSKSKVMSSIIPFAGPVFRKSFKEPLDTM
ncbi:hypothetical protein SAMN05428938_6937 [Streptomyces sp. KS_5]|nr:hypothetical protein SAMN05216482_1134 [Streptomyces sp. PAN_FS17]SEE05701.1 hypothetical protein SAMN05428938_6937 [Streptomyces sp. KS_5]